MKKLFSNLSNLFNLSKENRLAYKGPDQPTDVPAEAEKDKPNLKPLGAKGTERKGSDILKKFGGMLDGMNLSGPGVSPELKKSLEGMKPVYPKTEHLEPRGSMNPQKKQEVITTPDLQIDTSRARMSDLQRALDDASKVELNDKQASKAYDKLTYQLMQMGPTTNLREDNFKSVQNIVGKALKAMPDFELRLAQVHVLTEKGMDRDVTSLVQDIHSSLALQQSGNNQLLAYLGIPKGDKAQTIASVD